MKYLAYGSNMLAERLRQRVASASNPEKLELRGYSLHFHKRSTDGSGKCNIVASEIPGAVVHAVIFDVSETEIPALDDAEGVGNGYRKESLSLSIAGANHSVLVYLAERRHPSGGGMIGATLLLGAQERSILGHAKK